MKKKNRLLRERKVGSADEQRTSILNDAYLKHVYEIAIKEVENFWKVFRGELRRDLVVIEIGAAGGITKELRPRWITLDVRSCEGIDVVIEPGTKLPFKDDSVDIVFLQDALHHISPLDEFMVDVKRIMSANGLLICREPSWAPIAQLVWRFFHPEDFSVRRLAAQNSKVEKREPMEGNQALAWYLFRINKGGSNKLINHGFKFMSELTIKEIKWANGLAFLLSGGTNFTTRVSRQFLKQLHRIESYFPTWLRLFGFSVWIVFEKKSSQREN